MHILAAKGLVSYCTNTSLPSSSFMLSNFFRFVGSNFFPFSRTSTHEHPSSPVRFFNVAFTPLGHRALSSFVGVDASIVLIGLLHDTIMQQTVIIIIVMLLQALIPFGVLRVYCVVCVEKFCTLVLLEQRNNPTQSSYVYLDFLGIGVSFLLV